MSTPKNQISVQEFASICEISEDGYLMSPILWSLNAHGKYRYWQIFIGIESSRDGNIAVNQDYINRKELPSGFYGVYWTESGVEGTKNPIISERTVVKKGKGIGRGNFTTPFTQAILDARSDFNKKERKGSKREKELLHAKGAEITFEQLMERSGVEKPWRVFAMALHDVGKNNNWRHVKYPCFIQPKLDGTMFIVVHHPLLPEITITDASGKKMKVQMDGYSRGRETYEGQDHILAELYPVLKKYPGLHLVGELWKPGYGLQDISGSSRRQLDSKIKSEAIKLDYNVFDCFRVESPDEPFEGRVGTIEDIMLELPDPQFVKQVPSYEVKNKEQLLEKYEEFLKEKMEGGVIRNLDSKHEFGINKEERSYSTLKIKPRPDAEFPVVGFKDGNGKEAGVVIWICAENDDGVRQRLKIDPDSNELLPLEKRKTFALTPNMDYDTRRTIFKKLTDDPKFFEEHIKGQLLTVNYSILSKDFLPQQPKALRFRDPKINELLLSL